MKHLILLLLFAALFLFGDVTNSQAASPTMDLSYWRYWHGRRYWVRPVVYHRPYYYRVYHRHYYWRYGRRYYW